MIGSCRLCKHVNTQGFDEPHGVCRRFPPTALSPTQSTFPLVHLDTFRCGEFFRGIKSANPTPSKSGTKERK